MLTSPDHPGLTAYDDTDAGFDPAAFHGFRVVYREEDGDWRILYVDGAAGSDDALAFGLSLAEVAGHAVQSYGVNEWEGWK